MMPAKKSPLYACLECGKKFYSVAAAKKASYDGCPNCNGLDIDLYVPPKKGLAGANAAPAPKEHPMA